MMRAVLAAIAVTALVGCEVLLGTTQLATSGCGSRGCNQGTPYDHPPDQTENPPRAVAEHGPPFWCTVSREDPAVGACSPRKAGCEDYRTVLQRKSVLTHGCVKLGAAVCFTAIRVADATRIERCFPSMNGCRDQRAIKAGKAEYTEVSACADVP